MNLRDKARQEAQKIFGGSMHKYVTEQFKAYELGYTHCFEQLNKPVVMQGLPIEFVEWLGDHYIKMHGGWIPKYSNQIKPNLKTTQEIFDAYHALRDILNCLTIAHQGSPTVGQRSVGTVAEAEVIIRECKKMTNCGCVGECKLSYEDARKSSEGQP